MEKPIIATTLSGLFLKSAPWKNAHRTWYEKAAAKLGDNSVLEWIEKPNYFDGVDKIMKRLYPDLSDAEKTARAREMFFDSVVENIKSSTRREEIINYFTSLKKRYTLVLITTNTKPALKKILQASEMEGFFDITETSKQEEKDDKRTVFDRFLQRYPKPIIYVGGDRKDSYDYCEEKEIPCVFANLENAENLTNVRTIHSLEELKEILV